MRYPVSDMVQSFIVTYCNQPSSGKKEKEGGAPDFEFSANKILEPVTITGHQKLIEGIVLSIRMQTLQPDYYSNFNEFFDHSFLLFGIPGDFIFTKVFQNFNAKVCSF